MKNLTRIVGVGLMAFALPFAAVAGGAKPENLDLSVIGMSSETAQTRVHAALTAIDGVKVKMIDGKSEVVHVTIDPKKVSPKTVVKALEAAGFEAKIRSKSETRRKEY